MRPLTAIAKSPLILLFVLASLLLMVDAAVADDLSGRHHPHHQRHTGAGVSPWGGSPWGPAFTHQPVTPSIRTALPMGPIYEDRFGRLCQEVFFGALARVPFQTVCQDRFGRWVSVGRP